MLNIRVLSVVEGSAVKPERPLRKGRSSLLVAKVDDGCLVYRKPRSLLQTYSVTVTDSKDTPLTMTCYQRVSK